MKTSTKSIISLLGLGAITAHYSIKAIGDQVFKKVFEVDKNYLQMDLVDFMPTKELKVKYMEQIHSQMAWFKKVNERFLNIKSYDGLLLDGVLISSNDNHKYMILVHGYNSDRYILLKQAYEFYFRGFNILLIDNRAYGKSEGKYTSFGFKEHIDLIQWIDKLVSIDDKAIIGLYGVSMGGATVVMTIGTKVDEHVKFVIEDSGFTNLHDELKCMLKKELSFAPELILNQVDNKLKETLGFSFDDIRPVDALKENEIPICFVHGKGDTIVPYDMALELYEANKGRKAFYPIDTTAHAYACYEDEYFDDLMTFINKYI